MNCWLCATRFALRVISPSALPLLIGRRNAARDSAQCFGVLSGQILVLPWWGLTCRWAPFHLSVYEEVVTVVVWDRTAALTRCWFYTMCLCLGLRSGKGSAHDYVKMFDLWPKQTGTSFLVGWATWNLEQYRGSPNHLLTSDGVRAQLWCQCTR